MRRMLYCNIEHYSKSTAEYVTLTVISHLEGVVERLCDIREVRSEGKLRDDVRQIHNCTSREQQFPEPTN